MTDRVVLRRWRDSRWNPIALFVDIPEGRPGSVLSYQHVGQHGAADLAIVQDTEPCPPNDPDAAALVCELRRIGYSPRLLRRVPSKAGCVGRPGAARSNPVPH